MNSKDITEKKARTEDQIVGIFRRLYYMPLLEDRPKTYLGFWHPKSNKTNTNLFFEIKKKRSLINFVSFEENYEDYSKL